MSHRWSRSASRRWRIDLRRTEGLAVAVAIVLSCEVSCELANAQSQGPTIVVAAPIVERTVTEAQMFVGTVEPIKHAVVGSAVDGRVVEYPVEEGDHVAQGQTLAQLMTDTVTLELAAAEAELENRRQLLAELENGARPEELEQARAKMAAAEARRNFLGLRRDRLQSASNRPGAVTEDEIDEAVSAAIEAEEAYFAAKAAYDLTVAGPRKEQIAQSRALLALQQAVVDRTADQLKKHTIISRFEGFVVKQHTEIGQWVSQGDSVAEVVAMDEVDVVVQVVEKSVPFIRRGETVRVEIPAIQDRMFEGTIVATVPQADLRARTFPVKVRVRNEIGPDGPLLKAGMYARVVLPVGGQRPALLVPKDAIVLGGPTPSIFIIAPGAKTGDVVKVERAIVQLGVPSGTGIQVIGNMRAGHLVVSQGNERLRPGQDVKLLEVVASASPASPASDESNAAVPSDDADAGSASTPANAK